MIPAIIGLAVSLAGSVASGVMSANKNKQAQSDLQARRDKAEREYLLEKNRNFLDTDTAKAAISALRKRGDKQMETLNNNAVKSGASEEAKVAAASSINESQADAITRLAGMGTQYQQQIKDRYLARVDGLDDALYNSKLNQAEAISGIMTSIGSTVGNGLTAYGSGAFDAAPKAPKASKIPKVGKVPDPSQLTVGISVKNKPKPLFDGGVYGINS